MTICVMGGLRHRTFNSLKFVFTLIFSGFSSGNCSIAFTYSYWIGCHWCPTSLLEIRKYTHQLRSWEVLHLPTSSMDQKMGPQPTRQVAQGLGGGLNLGHWHISTENGKLGLGCQSLRKYKQHLVNSGEDSSTPCHSPILNFTPPQLPIYALHLSRKLWKSRVQGP